MSQNKQILKHLQAGKPITAIEALNLYGCFRLAARCSNLRDQGHIILTTMVTRNKKRIALYHLIQTS